MTFEELRRISSAGARGLQAAGKAKCPACDGHGGEGGYLNGTWEWPCATCHGVCTVPIGFAWRPYPPPAGAAYRLTIGQFYDVRNEHSDYHAEYMPDLTGYETEFIFVHGDGEIVRGVNEVFCAVEES